MAKSVEKITTDITESNFESLLEEKRHKELIEVLKNILSNLTTISNNKIDINVLESKLISLIEKINKKEEKSPSSILLIGESILKVLRSLEENQNTDWFFKIERDLNLNISSVTAERIRSNNNQINIPIKPKK